MDCVHSFKGVGGWSGFVSSGEVRLEKKKTLQAQCEDFIQDDKVLCGIVLLLKKIEPSKVHSDEALYIKGDTNPYGKTGPVPTYTIA